jgi:NAD(P)-dependent dehydrogenase (short-subunit alcohol dehydrogenase family)
MAHRPIFDSVEDVMQIEDSAVLVTGGSAGLGAALGRELARRGARVVLCARGAERLDAVVYDIRKRGGIAHGLPADMSAPDAVAGLVGAASALVGPLDVLVHNASSLGPVPLRGLAETGDAEFAAALEANLLGPFRLTRAVMGSMVLRARGLVVGISSDAAVVPYPRWGTYGVSKAGLDHLMRIWAAEMEGAGVRFLSLDPGEMDTDMHAAAMPEADRAALASPATVAVRVAGILAEAEAWPSGSRVQVGTLVGVAS